jgi:hypothetical protein
MLILFFVDIISFTESVDNYIAISDNRRFSCAAADKFLGETLNDRNTLEGNSFVWHNDDWGLIEDCNVRKDFPGIKTWEMNLNALIRNQYFTHIQSKNQQQPINNRDESNDNGIGENINKNIRKNDNNNNDQFSDTDEPVPYHLSDEYLSKTPHNVLIAEALRSIKSNLTHHNVVT